MIHHNSLKAHRSNRYSKRCKMIIDEICENGPGTCRELIERLGLRDMNQVRPRVTELVKSGALREIGEKRDNSTGKMVMVVGLPEGDWGKYKHHVEYSQQVFNFVQGMNEALRKLYTGSSD